MAFAESTIVSVEKSRAEIERLLMRHRCTKFMCGTDNEQHRATVQFQANNRIIRFEIALPNPADPAYRKMKNSYLQRSSAGITKVVEQASRTRWRALLLVIKAKLESIESGIATFEDEFLAHIVLPNQQTVAQYIAPAVARMYETGLMPPADRQLTSGDV
jgi:AcrR family transcriptional regulator